MKKRTTKKHLAVELSREQCDYVAERAAEYGSASEYVADLIRRDKDGNPGSAVERELLAGLKSGPMVPFAPDYFANLCAQVRAAATPVRRTATRKSQTRARRK